MEQLLQLHQLVLKGEVEEGIHTQEADLEAHHVREEEDHHAGTEDVHHLTPMNLDQDQGALITLKESESHLGGTDHQAVGVGHRARREEVEITVGGAQLNVEEGHQGLRRPIKSDNTVAVEAIQRASRLTISEFLTWKRAAQQHQPTTSSFHDLND